ncbi:DUF1015 domain-containing protein [Halanaerobium salsuginis]|jgi:uncharacterized protein (DUF1015 family)|uniref:Uncharacterized conserved protein, DUF1015 family n=1 Tax=Halanaerobium salsuginis TaxID=29563 RepID=A0A1I4KTH8_9FIRM|nr:DUF1015 domain-containing protein [Halanaerobium salsuginis]SFL81946.1 Uncharacterized conserved protein, DUF1015 family [Halanaerobium salsuginis]
MAEVFPFHGYHYNLAKVKDLNEVVTQPYDKIDQELQKNYYQKSPYNIVRLILGKEDNRYQNAAEKLQTWIENEIIIRDQEAAFYFYTQEYFVGENKFIRKGFVGLGKLDAGSGVKAHENTMAGPKADRLNLIRATEANFGHIFMLYSDQKSEINNLLNDYLNKPALFEVKDDDNNLHKVWQIVDKNIIDKIQAKMKEKTLYIADGHHRYQTALNFKKECEDKGWKSVGTAGFNHRLMTFINMDDPGLQVLATHRLLYGIKNFNLADFLNKAAEDFSILEFNQKEKMYQYLDSNRADKVFGFKTKQDNLYRVLKLKNKEILNEIPDCFSTEYKELAVTILHKIILEGYLGIDERALAEKTNLDYIRYRDQALAKLDQQSYQAAFILNPTTVAEVQNIADQGEKMPQKSTDFYPKLLTGLILNKLTIQK